MGGSYADVLAACTRLAGEQHGVIGRPQALAVGLSTDAVDRLVRARRWLPVHPSVYALWIPSDPAELWRHRLMAAALWLGAESAVSQVAAGAAWELDGIRRSPLELSTTSTRRDPTGLIMVHRVCSLDASDIVLQGRLPVTSPARTLVDLGKTVDAKVLEMAAESALRRRLTTRDRISTALDRAGPRARGRRTLLEVLGQARTTGSPLEVLAWQLIREARLPFPIRQHPVRAPNGRLVGIIDLAYPRELIAIELDGFEHHSSRRAFRKDRVRQNELTMLGWIVYRATKRDLKERPERFQADLARLLAGRDQTLRI